MWPNDGGATGTAIVEIVKPGAAFQRQEDRLWCDRDRLGAAAGSVRKAI